jgi:adenylate cyclase
VVSHLVNHQVELGGDKLPVTILFSDIRGFTSISEQLEAQELVALLNEYFTEMVDIVMDHGGVVDKYIGDAIMVIFGAPVPGANDALNAVRAALAMRESLARLNTRLEARGAQIIRTGIGIHSGEVIAGNIGSERRMEYTVIGDAVNLASRLESSTKDLGADLVISEATYALTRDHIVARPLGTISVKGREQPVDVYAVDGARAADAAG